MAASEPEGLGLAPHGAQINQTYLVRKQRSIAVNEGDLRELLALDAVQHGLMGVGTFLFSGALWLGIEKLLEQDRFTLTPILALCIVSVIAGFFLFVAGYVLLSMRRGKIRRMFDEIEEVQASHLRG